MASFRVIFYAYIIGGFTLVPLILCALVAYTIYTSEPVAEDAKKKATAADSGAALDVQDMPKTRKGWLTVRRTFEETTFDGGYVNLVRNFLDARSKDPKRSRPKDMWYVVLKGQILYLYEDEAMTECEAAIQLASHDVAVYPEGLLDGELFTKRNALCLKPKQDVKVMPSLTREMKLDYSEEGEGEKLRKVAEAARAAARDEAMNAQTPWFIFVRSTVEMEDWYLALIHASQHPAQTPTLDTLQDVFSPSDMNLLVSTLDEQPDIIPMRWFNALFGRLFYSFYRTEHLEAFIIGRLMKKLSKVKRPTFLNDVIVTDVSVGNRTPVFSKPMLKNLTKEGEASVEVHVAFKGEVRITIQATATINLGARFKPYTVKLVLAAVLRELDGDVLIKIKRPPSNRIWYAFTQMPRMVLNVEPVVSDRQITWGMILSTIESSLKTIIQESIVMPNMDDIAFFDTVRRKGMNRAGIWADAARKHNGTNMTSDPTVLDLEQESPAPDSHSQKVSVDPSLHPIQKTLSVDEISLASSSTLPEESSSPPNRRKTWFSSVRGVDTNMISDDNLDFESRGRTLDVDGQKPTAARSQSTPKAESALDQDNDEDRVAMPSSLAAPASFPKQRSASQSSVRESNALSEGDRARANSHGSSLSVPAPGSGTPPSPTNFLTTLKNRDKQALSNSAKETVRKWGMKLGNLNKDLMGSSSNSSQSQSEEMPDHDTVAEGSGLARSRSRTTSAFSSLSGNQKARASYAEVRAAVAERKDRSEHQHSRSGSVSLSASAPIVIPTNTSDSQNSEVAVNGSSAPALSHMHSSSSSSNRSAPEVNGDARSVSISTSTSTSSSSSAQSTPPVDGTKLSMRSHTNPDLPADESVSVHSPIHVQPQSKTMYIPGIHASHRGEIMSMGSVAPSPMEELEKEGKRDRTISQGTSTLAVLGATSMGSLSRNPKVQSVYRLWKQASSNSNSNQEGQDATQGSSNGESTEENSRDTPTPTASSNDSGAMQTSTVLPASMTTFSKHAPPPLPPRPSPVTISPLRPPPLPPRTPSQTSSASHQSLSPSMLASQQIVSSAQDALKEIAIKDDHTRKRVSLTISSANSSISGSPPSPTIGRRVASPGQASLNDPAIAPAELSNSSQPEIDATRAWGLDDDNFGSESPD